MNVSRMTQVTAAIKRGLVVDPVLRDARDKVRIFNRLNHRKIFLVKKPGGAGCVIVGGRNVGDPYLTGSAEYKPGDKSFIDGDILVCSHHLPRAQVSFLGAVGSAEDMRAIPEDLLAQVSDSFDNLKVDRFDPYLQQKNVSIRNLQMIRGFRPTEIAADFASGPVPQLKTIEVQGLKLKNFGSPRLLVSSWEPKQDEVQNALLTAIDRETKEIYIETPYAEFNHRLRIALEKALKRGVRVHVVTNGMFISDGPAKVIRLWMAHWNSKMRALHPKLFKIEHATLAYGKLIHFKAAGFRCQKMANGLSRTYIVGSHNFHPRSGYSDKENSLQWFEPAQDNCRAPVRDDLIAERRDYYRQLEKRSPVELLKTYSSLYEELHEVLKSAPKKSDSDFARGIIRALYDYDAESGSYVLWREADLVHILEVVEDSELRDLIGVFF